MKIAWKPTPKQIEALTRNEFEILFGGGRGGGKTDAGQAWLLYDKDNPRYRALVVRRNADDLRDWVDRARRMYASTGAEFAGNPAEIRFPSGAIIRTGHLKDENAYTKYQGHEYQKMLIEELTQIESEQNYLKLIASCRSTVPELKPQIFSSTNPGGIGHKWVKKRFIDVAEYGHPYVDPITGQSRIFIPALIEDNPHLMRNDPAYAKQLEALPPNLRNAWRYGDWESYEVDGAYFGKEMKFLRQNKRIGNVPWDPALKVITAWDLGINDTMSIWFFQVLGKEVRVIDYYENSGEGLPHYAKVLQDKQYVYDYHLAPHDIEVRELGTGKSRYETARELGITFRAIPNLGLLDGIESVRSLLYKCWFDAIKCEIGITYLENYRKKFNEHSQVFDNLPVHDAASHAADSFRTFSLGFQEEVEAGDVNDTRLNDLNGDDAW